MHKDQGMVKLKIHIVLDEQLRHINMDYGVWIGDCWRIS